MTTFPPLNVLRKASFSSRVRSALILTSLDETGEDKGTHDLILPALLAVPGALVRLHLCRASALHADRRANAVAYRRFQKLVDVFEPLGFAKLEEPNGPLRQMDAMDGSHLLLLATETRTIRISDREAEELGEFSGPASGWPPSRSRTPSGEAPANKRSKTAEIVAGEPQSE